MDVGLPQDVWVLIATELLQRHGRNDFLHLRAASKSTFHALDYAPLWKDMIFQTHFRLFDKADPSMMDAMTAPHWRKLLLGFSALGLRSQDDKVGFRDLKRTKVLRWLPEWGEKDEEDEEKATTKNEENSDAKNEEDNASGEEDSNEDDADDGYNPEGDELMAKNEIIYGLSTLTNTCSFWFSHRKAKDGSPLDIKIGDLVNGDPMRQLESDGYRTLVDNEELVKSLYSIYPRLGKNEVEMTALHAVITPEYIGPNEDTYIVDPVYRWDEIKYFPKRNIGCYRYKAPINPLPCHTHGATRLTHVLLPLQDPERVGFNEERVTYYQEQMKQGALPTVLALSRVINKYRYYDFNDPSLDFREQQIVVHAIVDGHHKLEAARRLNWPVGILMVCPARDRVVLEAIHRPIPCWPYSRYDFAGPLLFPEVSYRIVV
jgi:hypothetical protein